MPAVSKAHAFLKAFALSGSITKAAENADVERGMHYRWLKDPKYARAYERAKQQAADVMEDEAVRRANEGVLEPVFYKGKPVGAIRRYSDGLLMFLLRGARPETYRERASIEHSGPDGGPIPVSDARLERLSDEELSSLLTVASKLAESPGDQGRAGSPVEKKDRPVLPRNGATSTGAVFKARKLLRGGKKPRGAADDRGKPDRKNGGRRRV